MWYKTSTSVATKGSVREAGSCLVCTIFLVFLKACTSSLLSSIDSDPCVSLSTAAFSGRTFCSDGYLCRTTRGEIYATDLPLSFSVSISRLLHESVVTPTEMYYFQRLSMSQDLPRLWRTADKLAVQTD